MTKREKEIINEWFARSSNFSRTYYEKVAELCVYLINKYGCGHLEGEEYSDSLLGRAILNNDPKISEYGGAYITSFDVSTLLYGDETCIKGEQKANREQIKKEFKDAIENK